MGIRTAKSIGQVTLALYEARTNCFSKLRIPKKYIFSWTTYQTIDVRQYLSRGFDYRKRWQLGKEPFSCCRLRTEINQRMRRSQG